MKSTKCILFIPLFLMVLGLEACSQSSKKMEMMDESAMSAMNTEAEESVIMEESYATQSSPMARASGDMKMMPPAMQKDNSVGFLTSQAANSTLDGNKKFIRTANLRFSVADVVMATHAIEDIIIAKKGFIINSTLTNEILYTNETRVSKDSIQVKTHNRLNGTLTLRVHYSHLDATLREIAPLAEQIIYRSVNADEVTFRLLANELEQARKKDKAARVKSISGPGTGHKLNDLLTAEESIDRTRAEADAATVAEKEMYDRIEYSTITISLWQEPTVISKMKLREVDIPEYRQSFFANVIDNISGGWYGLLAVIEVLFAIWPLLVTIGGIVFLIVYFRRKKKRSIMQ